MATTFPIQEQRQQALAYEQYVRANWDNLSPNEQEQARIYFQAYYQTAQPQAAAGMSPGWTVALGYICCAIALLLVPILFAAAGFGLGYYNKSHGRAEQGKIQMGLAVACGGIGMILGAIVWANR